MRTDHTGLWFLLLGVTAVSTLAFFAPTPRPHHLEALALARPVFDDQDEPASQAVDVVDDDLAQEMPLSPLTPNLQRDAKFALLMALASVEDSRRDASLYANLSRDASTLDEALTLLDAREVDAAVVLLERVLEVSQPESRLARALWLLGDAEMLRSNPRAALDAWDRIDDDHMPVPDYLELRRISALVESGRASRAADRALALSETLSDRGDRSRRTLHLAREARLEALIAAERWDDFADEAEGFLDVYDEYPRRDQLLQWLGQSQVALGDLDAAAEFFDAVLWQFPHRPVAESAQTALHALVSAGVEAPTHSYNDRFERCRGLLFNKHWQIVDVALAQLIDDVVADDGESGFVNEIRMMWARNAYGRGHFDTAAERYQAILDSGAHGVRRYEVLSKLSLSLARMDLIEEGADALRRRDRNRSTVRRHLELGEYYYENGRFGEALAHQREALSADVQRQWDFTLLLFLAGEYDEAAVNFENLADGTTGSDRRRYRYWQARSLQEAGDLNDARSRFEDIADVWPRTYYGLQSVNRLAEMDRDEPPTYVADRDEIPLIDDLVAQQRAAEARQRDVPSPLVWGDEDENPSLEDLADGFMWRLNSELTALVHRELPEAAPEDSDEPERFVRPARIHWDGPDGVSDTLLAVQSLGQAEVDSAYFEPVPAGSLESLVDDWGHLFPELERAQFLLAIGDFPEAFEEAREASTEFRALHYTFRNHRRPTLTRPVTLRQRQDAHYIDNRTDDTGFWGIQLRRARWQLPEGGDERAAAAARQVEIYENRETLVDAFRLGLSELGDHHFVRRFARERRGWSRSAPDGEHRQDWSEAYARAYPELVTQSAANWDLNPYIIWSLMTVESSYNPDSISRANARGLLQVIPKTGELISQRLGLFDFGPHNLMNPELSIEFGCYYFSELMEKFHGQELLAFSAYNGGPHNMARWLDGRGDLPLDAFIETIPFRQAREYTKKVYRYLALYRLIYLGEDSLYVGQEIDADYELNIHF